MLHRQQTWQGATPPCRSPATPASCRSGTPMLVQLPAEVKQQDPFFGARICKNFGNQWFHGRIVDIEVDEMTGEPAYFVEYDDGDAEHLSESGVRAHLWRVRDTPVRRSSGPAPPPLSPANGLRHQNGCTAPPPTVESVCAGLAVVIVIALVGAVAWLALGGLWARLFHPSAGQEACSVDDQAISALGSIISEFPPVSGDELNYVFASQSVLVEPSNIQASDPVIADPPRESARISERDLPVPTSSPSADPWFREQVVPHPHHVTPDISLSSSHGAVQSEGHASLETASPDSDQEPLEWVPGDADLDLAVAVVVILAVCACVGCCKTRCEGAPAPSNQLGLRREAGQPLPTPISPMPVQTVPSSPPPDWSPSSAAIKAALAPLSSPTMAPASPLPTTHVQKSGSSAFAGQPMASTAAVATPARASAVPQTPQVPKAEVGTARAPKKNIASVRRTPKLVSPSRFRYSNSLAQLRAMGIDDSADVREALTYCQGRVDDALQELFGQ